MKLINQITLLGFLCILLFSCRTDSFTETSDPPIFVETHLSGVVLDTDDQPITNANVSVSGISTETDKNGVFNFRNIDLASDGSLIKINKIGYFDGFLFANGEAGKQSYLETVLVEKESKEFQSSIGATIEMNDNATVIFEPNSIATGGGSPYNGVVEVSAHWYDPSSDETALSMPGDLRGSDLDANVVQLVTYGMMAVELRSPSGVKLQLASGSNATLKFPIPKNSDVQQYDVIPMWYLDEETGVWIEEGESKIEGDFLVGEVSHFSYWNCDVPYPLINITGSLISESGSPLSFQRVLIKDNNNNISRSGYTNALGVFSGKVPADVDLTLFHYACDGANTTIELGTLTMDTDLDPIIVDTENSISLSAILEDCDMEAITYGYVKIISPTSSKIITTDENGVLDYEYFHCNQTDITLVAYDLLSAAVSDPVIINTGGTAQDLETIFLCGAVPGEYIRFTIDGTPFAKPLEQIEVFVADDRILYIYAYHKFDSGNNDPSTLLIKYDIVDEVAINSEVYMSFDNGVFKGELNVFIDDLIESGTISGKVWMDENENGLQDTNESPIPGKRISMTYWPPGDFIFLSQAGYSLYPQPINQANFVYSDNQGNFEFKGVFTEKLSRLTFQSDSGETVTIENVGNDDTLDSDFYDRFNTVDQYNTDDFILEAGGVKTDFGLGLK